MEAVWKNRMSQEIGPFALWRLLMALATTAILCASVWLVIQYFLGAFEAPIHVQDRTPKSPVGVQTPAR
jgi:hypothetical protein